MTDEQNKVEEIKEDKECGCCECRTILSDFLLRLGAVFLGTLLAILVAASVLRPLAPAIPCNCNKGMMGVHGYGFERQMPPHQNFARHGEHRKHTDKPNFDKMPKLNKGYNVDKRPVKD